MASVLEGYDMALAISQNEINSQFERLYTSGVIDPQLRANGLTSSSGPFGGGDLVLATYIRGYVGAPTVELAHVEGQDREVLFHFDLLSHPVTAPDLGVTDADLEAAFASSPDGTYALLSKREDLPYRDAQGAEQTLAGQEIRYWLTRQQQHIGTVTQNQYALEPAIYFSEDGQPLMIRLAGLRIQFRVLLSQEPTTVAEIQQAVQDGVLTHDVLRTIQDSGFTASAFSLERLFLNFDTTDFTQWDVLDPAGALGDEVTGITFQNDGAYQAHTAKLSDLLANDPGFANALSTNLQYAFGVSGKNTRGRSPYILHIIAQSTDPSKSNPNQPPSLVPTYIGFSTSPNPQGDAGLGALNYEILGGDDPKRRVPRNADGTTRHLTTDLVTSNDFSGELAFARSVFFDPFLLQRIQAALGGGSWSQDGRVWTRHTDTGTQQIYHKGSNANPFSSDFHPTSDYVYQRDQNSYRIEVQDDQIRISGTTTRRVDISIYLVAEFGWWKQVSAGWSQVVTMAIGADQQLAFQASPFQVDTPKITDGQDAGGTVVSAVSSVFKTLSGGYFPTPDDVLRRVGDQIKATLERQLRALDQHLIGNLRTNFISPTGKVLFLNKPRLDDAFDLRMDVTFSV